jgi:hypothetical protein
MVMWTDCTLCWTVGSEYVSYMVVSCQLSSLYVNLYRTSFKFHFRAEGTEFSPRWLFKLFRMFDNKCL